MPSMQVKEVPEEVHAVWRRRAANAGQSLQEYMLAHLTEAAQRETVEEVFARIEQQSGGAIGFGAAVEMLRADRDR